MTEQELLKLAHRTCSRYHHNHMDPKFVGNAEYTFTTLTLLEFCRKAALIPPLWEIVTETKEDDPLQKKIKDFSSGVAATRERVIYQMLKGGYTLDEIELEEKTWWDEEENMMRYECRPKEMK